MKQWNFKMKTLCSKTLTPWLKKWTDQCMPKWEISQKRNFLYYCIVTLKKLKYYMSYMIKLHCWWGDVLSGEQEIVTKEFLERFGPYIENVDQKMNFPYDSDEIEVRLVFYGSFSTFWNIFVGLCIQVFYSSAWVSKWLKVICVVKSKVIQPQPINKTRNFLKCNRLLRDIHWNQKQIGNCYSVSL